MTPPEHQNGIYPADLYDPRRRISREYFVVFALYAFVLVVVGMKHLRATGRSLARLLVPGYTVYLLLRAPDR
ncbi:hypothetical protein [Lewinella sp. IMCC34191]|uniref:hypothetical protein n=1 Tax=Lewinella sp. IMCC34191 TaxID=2259172 RepID=UPI000E26B3F2|nr:hypothetical protein [Lewinella sp. IMCC34191]